MAFFKEELSKIKAFVFDVHGVISSSSSNIDRDGESILTINSKDFYALSLAVKQGYKVAVISEYDDSRLTNKFKTIGVDSCFFNVEDKLEQLDLWINSLDEGISRDQIICVGDDMPDIKIMDSVLLSVAPADGAQEAKSVSDCISPMIGGGGVVRDVIEQVLKAQSCWYI